MGCIVFIDNVCVGFEFSREQRKRFVCEEILSCAGSNEV